MSEASDLKKAKWTGRRDTPKSHYYLLDGDRVPGVTTIAGVLPKFLENYYQRCVAEEAVKHRRAELDDSAFYDLIVKAASRDRDSAGNLGTRMHGYLERIIAGENWNGMNIEEDCWPLVRGGVQFIHDHNPKWLHTEIVVGSRRWGYMGTLDWIAEIDGQVVLGDWKSSRSGLWPAPLSVQLAGYRYAEFYIADGVEKPMPHVDACWGVWVQPETYTAYELTADESVHRTLLYCLEIYRHDKGSKDLMTEMTPPVVAVPRPVAPAHIDRAGR